MSGGHNKGRPNVSDAAYKAKLISRCTVTATGCWEIDGFRVKSYGGKTDGTGYGFMCYRGKNWPAHRISYFLHTGVDPGKLDVMHKCDNPPCCNPDHLQLGTRKQNIHDCFAKGRRAAQQITHCPRGHAYAEHGRIEKSKGTGHNGKKRACRVCQRMLIRKRAGWPESHWWIPPQQLGVRPPFTSIKAEKP